MKLSLPRFSLFFLSTVCIYGCGPDPGVIPTHEAVAQQNEHAPTLEEAKIFCQTSGGKIEDWKNKDGSTTTYCIMPQGYGCDPVEFAKKKCGPGL